MHEVKKSWDCVWKYGSTSSHMIYLKEEKFWQLVFQGQNLVWNYSKTCALFSINTNDNLEQFKSMAPCNTTVTALLMHCSYCSLALSHQNYLIFGFCSQLYSIPLLTGHNLVLNGSKIHALFRDSKLFTSLWVPRTHGPWSSWVPEHWEWVPSLIFFIHWKF